MNVTDPSKVPANVCKTSRKCYPCPLSILNIHTMEYYSALKKEQTRVSYRDDVNGPTACRTKSEREKQISCTHTQTWGIQETSGTGDLICRAGIDMQMQRMEMWTPWGRETVGGVESVPLTCTVPCIKQTAGGRLLYSTRSSARSSVMTYKGGWGWEGGSRAREYMYTYSWFTLSHSRNKTL